MMDIKRLGHIVALADKRNFARAAEHANLSQPALTRSIQAAEAELGLRLFDRGTLAITPTPAGEFVLERARRLVFDSACLKRDIALYRDRQLGDTAFGVGPFPAATFLSNVLVELRREFASINLRVEVGNWEQLAQRLREEDIEFFVADTRDLPHDPRLQVRALRKEPGSFYVRAKHPLAARKSVSLKDLWPYGIATVRLPRGVRGVLARLIGLAPHAALPIAVECDDVDILKRVALGTDTVLAAPDASVRNEVEHGAFVPLPVRDLPPLYSDMGIVMLRGRSPSPMADLIARRLPGLTATPSIVNSPATKSLKSRRRRTDMEP